MFGNGDTTGINSWIYLGESGTPPEGILGNNFRGPNWFKDSFFKAYRAEYNERLWVLNNTYLHPDNLKTLYYRNSQGTLTSYYNFINAVKAGFCEDRFANVNTQTGHAADGSDFLRPAKPVNRPGEPAEGALSTGTPAKPAAITYSATGTYGTATLDIATATITYLLDDARAATDALAEGQAVSDTAIRTTGLRDLYLALGDDRGDGRFAVRAYVSPLAPLIWLGALVMSLGGLLSLWGRLRWRAREPVPQPAAAE
jgi:hypothetical protein